MDVTIDAVLDRVAHGMATEADAAALRRWLFPDERTRIVEAFLTLSTNLDAARRYLAPELRRQLAERLVAE